MKMSQELFTELHCAISQYDNQAKRGAYIKAGLSSERYRWDTFWGCVDRGDLDFRAFSYEGLSDSHIDTALKKIVPDLIEE